MDGSTLILIIVIIAAVLALFGLIIYGIYEYKYGIPITQKSTLAQVVYWLLLAVSILTIFAIMMYFIYRMYRKKPKKAVDFNDDDEINNDFLYGLSGALDFY